MVHLGVNVDRVAVLHGPAQPGPDPAAVAVLAALGGADSIGATLGAGTGGLAPDDLRRIRDSVSTPLHLRFAPSDAGVRRACGLRPGFVTLAVREGGRHSPDRGVADRSADRVARAVERLGREGIRAFLAVGPEVRDVAAAVRSGVHGLEIDTRSATEALREGLAAEASLRGVRETAAAARAAGLRVLASGGIDEGTLPNILAIEGIDGVRIGAAFVARAVLVGALRAVAELRYLIGREVPLERLRSAPEAGPERSS
jgi:pyridoxine 5-phosphate synthase